VAIFPGKKLSKTKKKPRRSREKERERVLTKEEKGNSFPTAEKS